MFMKPEITQKKKWAVDTSSGEITPLEYASLDDESEVIEGYGARFSAAGYLDCTDWSVFGTVKEAARYLLTLIDDDDSPTEDDKEIIEELEQLAKDKQ